MPSDSHLMKRVQQGELTCLGMLFERYQVKLYNYFLRMTGQIQLSEDLLQESFIRVLRFKESYLGEQGFSPWLYRLAHNIAIDHFRKNNRQNGHQQLDEQHLDVNQPDPQCAAEKSQQQSLFFKALMELNPEQREIIVLSRYSQLKYDEIAQLMGYSLSGLKGRMRTAIDNLKRNYDELEAVS